MATTPEEMINILNTLRAKPSSQKKRLDTISKALIRSKKEKEGKELAEISNSLTTMKPLNEYTLSDGLNNAAQERLDQLVKLGDEHDIISDEDLLKLVEGHCDSVENPFIIIDHGDDIGILSRFFISDHDPDRTYKKNLFAEYNNVLGVATSEFEEETLTVIILAEKVTEIKQKDYGEFNEIKEIFDLLDQDLTGKLEPSLIKEAFHMLHFETKNPTFFEIIDQLDNKETKKNGGIDFDTFKDKVTSYYVEDRKTKKQLKAIFKLFIDDSEEETISIANVKRISKHLDEEISPIELKKLMNWSTINGSELSFDEFYDIMTVESPEVKIDI